MDDTNWRPMQGSNPAAGGSGAVEPNAPAEGDWRAQLQPGARSRIVNKIFETLRKCLSVELGSPPSGSSELQKIAAQFEERIYAVATSQADYLRKISLKMLSMEMKTQEAPGNAQVIPNQNNSGQASAGSTAQTCHPDLGVGDCQEEIYQMGDIAEGDASYDAEATTTAATQPKSSSSTTTPTTYAIATPRLALFSTTNPIPAALAPRPSPSAPAKIRAPKRRGAYTSPRKTSPAPSSTTPAPEHANVATRRPSRYRRPSGKIKGYLTASNIDNMTVEDMKKM